jgi:hypothetical protein
LLKRYYTILNFVMNIILRIIKNYLKYLEQDTLIILHILLVKLIKLALCGTINTTNDEIVNKLCKLANIAEDTDTHSKNDLDLAERFASSEKIRLHELKEQVGKKKRFAPQKYKKDYAAIYDNLESKRISIQKMLSSELLEYKAAYESGPDKDIEEIRRLDNIIRREQVAHPPVNPFLVYPPPSFISAANIVPGSFGWAPPAPPPPYSAPYYVEYGTNRPMQWNHHYGRFYYLGPAPAGSLLPLPGQPPLPSGPPPQQQQSYRRRGGTQKNINRNNKTMKKY